MEARVRFEGNWDYLGSSLFEFELEEGLGEVAEEEPLYFNIN